MKKTQSTTWKITASLVCTALLVSVGSASAALTITTNNQNSASAFTPTWPVADNSLIAGLLPSDSFGNFTQESAGGLATLTDQAIGPVLASGNQTAMATCGNNGGRMVIYDLPASANGFDITNISTYSGWGNGGRHAQAYTLYYSTQAAPRKFISLGSIAYTGGFTGNNPNQPSANQVIWSDSNNGSIAANVAAIMFDFNSPVAPNGENGYSGYSEITVQGTPSATVVTQVVTIAMSNTNGAAPFDPGWTLETPSLIAGRAPFSTTGSFDLESPTLTGIRDINSLTANGDLTLNLDNIAANNNGTTTPNYLTCGGNACTSIIYALTNSPNGSDVTNIVVYNGWADNGRDGQYYTILYSTVAQPTTYLPISTVYYLPNVPGSTPSANRVAISSTNGVPLASAVANLKFDFGSVPAAGAFNNGYQGYGQIIVQGNDTTAPPPPPSPYLTQDTLPTHAETFVGDQVVFTAVYSNAPPADVQWLVIKGSVTNILSGATNGTLTLNNVQTTDSGSYQLMAVNATNSAAAPSYSTAASLVVTTPSSLGNIIVQNSGQTGAYPFYPYSWTNDVTTDLIYGSPTDGSGSPGTATAGAGSYGNQTGLAGDPTILVDGVLSDTLPGMVSCGWVNVGAGQSMTYTLPTQTYGYNITNISVYGGWPDDGRNEQKYQVLYSTVTDPTTFVSIGTFDYNPSFTSGEPNSTRVKLVAAAGALAQNVYALEINFNMQSKNNWNGYSEIKVNGNPSTGLIPALTKDITPNTAEDVKGSSLIMSANFSGATGFQWQKNGTNISGATTTNLTLNNLQLTDTATNGGYRLLGINSAGTNFSRGCSVIVDSIPAATNNVVTAFAYQSSDAAAPNTFGPTWDTTGLGSSLIAYAFPTTYDPIGNFSDPDNNFPNSAGGLGVLTDGGYGVFAFDGSHPAFATAGPTAGQYVVYTLGYDPNGYDVTNIQIAGGWNDNGRNSQFYTVSYSTVQNPTLFTTLNAVSISPSFPSESVIRTTMTPATGVLASNVYAVEINFLYPQGVPNGYSGYSEISVFGSASANPPPTGPVITAENELGTNNIWTVETPNLIANQLPSSYGPGVFTEEGCNEANLTDGVIGFGFQYGASCGDDGIAVPWIIFNSASGWNLTNIVVYSLWNDYGRDGQFYNLSYSTLSDPTTFVPLTSVSYNPDVPTDGTASGNRVAISPAPGQTMLASNVYAVKFDFTPQGTEDFGWSGYSEIVLQGSNLVPATIATFNTPTISGGNLILSGTGGTPNFSYTVLTTTNLLTPLADWTVSTNGTTDGTGAYSTAIPVSAAPGGSFYQLRMP